MTIAELVANSGDNTAYVLIPKFWRHDGCKQLRIAKPYEVLTEIFTKPEMEQELIPRRFKSCLAVQLPYERRDYAMMVACKTREELLAVVADVVEKLSAHERTVRSLGG